MPPDLKVAVERAAGEEERSVSQFVHRALRVAIEAHEAQRAAAAPPPATSKKRSAAR